MFPLFSLSFLICGMGAGGCACPTGWAPASELAVMRDDSITCGGEGPPPQARVSPSTPQPPAVSRGQ